MSEKCLNCDTPIESTEGKRKRKFCSDLCRATYHQKSKTIESEIEKELPKEFRKKVFDDLWEFGMAITKNTENGLKRVEPLTEEWWKLVNSKIADNNKPENKKRIEEERGGFEEIEKMMAASKNEIRKSTNDLYETGVFITHTSETGEVKRIDPFSDEGEKVMREAKILELEKELEAIPDKTKGLGKTRASFLKAEIDKLKTQLH